VTDSNQQQYQSEQYNQPPPLEQQYYNRQQGQHITSQPYSYQQQQQFYPQYDGYQACNNTNRLDVQTLPPPEPTQRQYTSNSGPQMLPGARGQLNTANYDHSVTFTPEAAMVKQPEVVMKEPEKPAHPPTPPKIGWTCPTCTVINEPFRPGCEVCGENRPEDYKPPADYKPTKDEEKFLQEDKGFEEVNINGSLQSGLQQCYVLVASFDV